MREIEYTTKFKR